MPPFQIYRSSAGSGKTRTLAREYILLALRSPQYFRHILAMTFTNKSTQEMKDRILHYLSDFSKGESEDLSQEILVQLNTESKEWTAQKIKERSKEVLDLLLHHYSDFSINTIDAFFQRIIRSFARETRMVGNFRLEVDNDLVLEEVVNLLMEELNDNAELRGWVLEFSMEQLMEGKNWDIRALLMDFSKEIFTEDFKKVEDEVLAVTSNKGFFKELKSNLWKEVKIFETAVFAGAKELITEFRANGLSASDFKHGKSGSVYSYTSKLTRTIELPGPKVTKSLRGVAEWPSSTTPQKELIVSLAQKRWLPKLTALVALIEKDVEKYLSAKLVLDNLYSFGLLSDISRTVKSYLAEKNLMLLSDSSKFLNTMMGEQDASFLYEKVGSFYRHFLIDEFQDTSGLQWSNLKPLIQNGLAQNYKSMIVGDIKQSIYRWRGGDLTILQDKVKIEIGEAMVGQHTLDTNYRSDGNVVQFNNSLFQTASQLIAEQTGTDFPQKAYQDAEQKEFHRSNKGFVKIEFLEASQDADGKTSFDESSLQRLPNLFESLQEQGVQLKDIAFLVRDKKDGQKIAQRFIEYRASAQAKPTFRYDVVSNESLLLDQSTSVLVLINAMRLLENSEHAIARAHLAYEYQKLWPSQAFIDDHLIFANSTNKKFYKWIPPSFVEQQERLAALPLVEMVESLIYIFKLGSLASEIPFLQSFQDVILEFAQSEKSDLTSFLVWWQDNKEKKSIQVAGGVDAAQIITIHKSKGLQFSYVIIPFLNWELNHGSKGPILWCKSNESLFKDAGYLPIKYKSDLSETYFKEYYETERQRIHLDNLNLLYVAFTRAENGLIAFAPVIKGNSMSHVGQLVRKAIERSEHLQSHWQAGANQLQIGAIESQEKKKEIEPSLMLKHYPVSPWRERLVVRAEGKEFFQQNQKREKINYGIFFHSLMSRIKVMEDVEREITDAIGKGKMSEKDRSEVSTTITWMMTHPSLKNCFEHSSKVKTEATLFLPNRGEQRVDRFAVKDDVAYVIDYKTGPRKTEDVNQLTEYVKNIRMMKYKTIKGYLVYVQEKTCEEVKTQ
ncbi:MAG: UvrD-helicase domain-containing protein [Cyclobacteriaceae bacterium]